MRMLLLATVLLPLLAAACRTPATSDPNVEATPTGPCRDDERLENGRCVTRLPGDNR